MGTKSWMENMENNGVLVDGIFLCIAANVFNKNIVIIPMDPNSAHHAKLYSIMDSFHGGSGDPLFMLYHEEWRGCGHYQSIEVDHHIQPNRVLQHLNWYVNKSVQQNSFPSVSSISQLLPAVQTPGELPKDNTVSIPIVSGPPS